MNRRELIKATCGALAYVPVVGILFGDTPALAKLNALDAEVEKIVPVTTIKPSVWMVEYEFKIDPQVESFNDLVSENMEFTQVRYRREDEAEWHVIKGGDS